MGTTMAVKEGCWCGYEGAWRGEGWLTKVNDARE